MSWGFEGVPEMITNEMKINFGKHKGKFVRDVPIEYCQWLIDNEIHKKYGRYFKKAVNKRARQGWK